MNFFPCEGMPDTRTAHRLPKKVQRPATLTDPSRRTRADQRHGTLHLCARRRCAHPPQPRVSPGAEREARLPVRHKLHCEAPTGVADPITSGSSEVDASTQEGG